MEELSASTCWAQLRTTPVGRIAVRGDGDDVEIFPINFVVDHGSVVFRTAAGTKLERIVATECVTFEADDSDLDDGIAWSVVAKGACTVIQVHGDVLDSFDLDVYPWHAGGKPTLVRLIPSALTGRRFTIDPAALARRRDP
ncbi:MAG: pyridoxamine 5'-phosphate oxidase family protein [Ilumatobacter sp.]|nr:pyridoxamine 5'-phosphate oxidase family protein [Ilumatobacter sp.]